MELCFDDWDNTMRYASIDLYNDVQNRKSNPEEAINFYLKFMKDEKTDLGYACKKLLETDQSNDQRASRSAIRGLIKINVGDCIHNRELLEKLTDEVINTYITSSLAYVSNLPNNTTTLVTDDITQSLTQLVCIMGKDIHGKLGTEETALLQKNVTKWQEQIQMMREQLKTIAY